MQTAYEAMYIIDAGQPEEQTTGTIDKYSGVITRGGGEIDDIDRMETRRLAYEIKGRREGLYVVMNFRSEPAVKDELERIFHISDDVLRHMVIKQDPKADRFPSKVRAAEQERRDREMAARMANAPAPAPAAAAAPVVDTAVTDLAAEPTSGGAPDAAEDAGDTAAAATAAAPPADVPAETTATAVDDPTAADAPAQTDEDTSQGEATAAEDTTETAAA